MNWGLLGHEWAVNLMRRHIAQGTVRHAYLFTGPQFIGRRSLAIRFAQALNCTQPPAPGDPCRICRVCRQIEGLQQPDLAVVQAEQFGGTLKVDQIRELQRGLALAPYEARYRTALLLRFEEAHASAANALLKTLEEPAPQVILLLTAESAESLLPTIVSRCEVLRLRPVALEPLAVGLSQHLGIPAEQAHLLAAVSAGRPGYAIRLYQHPEQMAQRQAWLDEHVATLTSSLVQRFLYAEKLTKDRDKGTLRDILLVWSSIWRDILLLTSGAHSAIANLDRRDKIAQLSNLVDYQTAQKTIASLELTRDLIEKNVNVRLAMEVLMLNLPLI